MAGKKLDINKIQNELSGGSAYFPGYKKDTSPTPPPQPEPETSPEQPKPPIPERPFARTPVRPNGRRIITRNSFETYEDQMDALRKISFKEKLEGKLGSMSAMVRDAIDDYIEKRSSEL